MPEDKAWFPMHFVQWEHQLVTSSPLVPLAPCPLFTALYWTVLLQHPSFWGKVADMFLCLCWLPRWLLAFAVVRDPIIRQTLIFDYSVASFYVICEDLISLNLISPWQFWFKSDSGVYVVRSTSPHCSPTRIQSKCKGQEYLSPNKKHIHLLWASTNYCKNNCCTWFKKYKSPIKQLFSSPLQICKL